jgi:hypothetical protein
MAAAGSVTHDLAVDAPVVFLYTPDVSYVVHSSLGRMSIPPTGGSSARFASVGGWRH